MNRQLPTTAKAAILVELGQPLVVDEVDLPESLNVGQVLVKVHYSGICGSQLGEIDGAKGEDRFLPHLLGHEGSGTVLAVGSGVQRVAVDDAVVLHWRQGEGIQSEPPAYRWKGTALNAGWITTFNEYAVISENRCTPIPADSNLQVAALLGCAVTTGFGVVENNARLRIGESIVVSGVGGIGLCVVQAASLVSGYPIVAVDRHANRLEMARQMGATHLVDASDPDLLDQILLAAGSDGVDVFADTTGISDLIEMGYQITKSEGRVILVGVPNVADRIEIPSLPLHFGKQLSGSHGGDGQPNTDIARYMKLHRLGRLRIEELVTDVVRLTEINQAIESIRRGEVGARCLVSFVN